MRPIISTIHTINDQTVMPNSTAKTLLGGATVILPSWAKSIMAVVTKASTEVPVASIPFLPQVDVESNDLKVMPFQVFAPPTASIIGAASHSQNTPKPEIYQMNVPCNGGEQMSIYGTGLIATGGTMTGFVGANLIISNMSPTLPQRKAKIGTLTTSGTAANADVAGTRYNFSGGTHIVELQGVAALRAPVASKGMAGHIKYTSNEFDGVSECKLDLVPCSGAFGTLGMSYLNGVSRLPVNVPVQPGQGQVNIQDYAYFSVISSTAGDFCSGVIYE